MRCVGIFFWSYVQPIAYPRDKAEKGGQNEFEIKFAIFDDSSDNVALAEPMKDLGTIKVVLSAND